MIPLPAEPCTPHLHTPYRVERYETTSAWGAGPSTSITFEITGATVREHTGIIGETTGACAPAESGANGTRDERREKRDHRLTLLARKYGRAGLSREDQARLTILNERLGAVAQRVTERDVAALEHGSQELADTDELLRALQERYGIET